jgi:hypothetical protein
MKKTILSLALILATFTTFAQAQTGGEISAKDNSATRGVIYRSGTMLKTWDSTASVWLSPLKLKTDSIYTKLNTGLTLSGIVKKTLATQVVSSDTGLVVNAVMHGLTTGGGGGYVDVKVNPSGALTVDATVDSTTQRKTIKVSELPSITIANTAFTANAGTNLNTSSLALESGNLSIISGNTSLLVNSQASTTSSQKGVLNLTATTTSAPTYTTATSNPFSTNTSGELRVDFSRGATAAKQPALGTAGSPSADVITIQGTSGARAVIVDGSAVTQPISYKSVIYDSTVTATAMTITNLSALASSATAGWQSARVSNLTAMASDYKITVRVSMANTAPANDKSIYVYAVPWGTTDGGTTWYSATGGTTTSPSGSEGTYTIVSAAPTNFRLLGVLNYQTADMNPCDNFLLSNAFGNVIPDAWSLVIVNYSGAALETTSGANNLVYYSPVYKTQR